MSLDAAGHLSYKPVFNKIVFCRLLAFLLLFSSAAGVYFVLKTTPLEDESVMPKPVIPNFYTKLEGVQPEERDVFQDFRTSFLPPEETVVPDAQAPRTKRNVLGSNFSSSLVWFGEAKQIPARTKRTTKKLPISAEHESQQESPIENVDSWSVVEAEAAGWGGEDAAEDGGQLGDDSSEDGYYDDYESVDDVATSISKEGTGHMEDSGPFDNVMEQMRAQPELEEGELGTGPLQYHPPRRYTGIHAFWKGQGDKETIRLTQASIMRQYMDADADPCKDFYQYACGNWPALNPIPADKAGYDTFEMLRENLDAVLKDLLDFKKGEYYPSEYPGPNLDLYDNILTQPKKESTHHVKEKNKMFNATTQMTTIIFIDNSNSSRQEFERVAFRTQTSSDLLHRMRRYLDQKSKKIQPHSSNSLKGFRGAYFNRRENKSMQINKNFMKVPYIKPYTIEQDKAVFRRLGRELQQEKTKNKREAISDPDDVEKQAHKKDQDPAGGNAALKARFLFKSCMNYDILQRRGHQPLLDLLELLGGWPILKRDWNSKNFDWIELMARLRLYNNDILLSEWVGPDIKNSNEFVIQFDQTSLGLPTRDYFLQDNNKVYLQAYQDYLVKIALLLGGDHEHVLRSSAELIGFEIRLASITSAPEDRRNVSELYRRMSLRRLEAVLPGVQWQRYLCIVMNRTVHEDETVVLFALKYVQNLVRLLNHTDPSTLSNYLLWRFVRHRVNNLDDRFQSAKQQFYNILFGREQAPPRWKNCITQVNSNMGMALGSMFVRKYFDETSKNDTLTMTREIQQSFRELLHLTDWIDDATKRLAAHKVDAMMLRIGYPDFILNKRELDERYQEVRINPDKYFENILNILQHLTKMEQARLGQLVNKTLWNTAPAVVNAYYSRNKNQIMFPAGILQPPFYHRHFPKSLNYGGIGVVIGHEITHGFDDKGRLFDCNGNLHRWWSDSAIEAFHRRAQCLINQYGRYIVPEVNMKLDGVNTQGENIADNGGVKQAFRAYQRWLKRHGTDAAETMPGLNHTHTQLFFLNFAQVWCGAMRPEAMRNKLKTAVHSPGRFRVIGALSNSEDFAREFSCAPGSPMNPTHKCSVW